MEAYLLRMVTTVAISYGLQVDCGQLTMAVYVMRNDPRLATTVTEEDVELSGVCGKRWCCGCL